MKVLIVLVFLGIVYALTPPSVIEGVKDCWNTSIHGVGF